MFWWWYAFLFVISGLQIIYRMIILAIPYYRKGLINDQTGTNDFNKIFHRSNMGDWFMLHQIGKNVDGHYFKLFINELVKTFPNDEMSPKSVCSKVYPKNPPNYGGNTDEEMSNADIISSAPPPAKNENWEYDY